MNKELTPLEALKKIGSYSFYNDYRLCNSEEYAIIETALKDSEWFKQEMIKFEKAFTEENEEKLKLKQALEVFKNHITNISFKYGGKLGNVIKLQIDSDTCYIHFNENDKNFVLLKEVLEKEGGILCLKRKKC